MLRQLRIENIAVIRSVDISFGSGLNILTGETGAGKSILIDAIAVVLGGRISKELVRTGADKSFVSALFTDLSSEIGLLLEEYGISSEEELLLSREFTADGKSAARINGRPATAQMLKDIGNALLNIHGQHDNQALLSEDKHIHYLDRMGDYSPLLESYRAEYVNLKKLAARLESLQLDARTKSAKIDLLTFQIRELESAELTLGETDSLTTEREALRNISKIAESMEEVSAFLSGGQDAQGITAALKQSAHLLAGIEQYIPDLHETAEKMTDYAYELEEMYYELCHKQERLIYDPVRMDEIEERLTLLKRLERKYGGDEESLLALLETCKKELSEIETADEQKVLIEAELTRCRQQCKQMSQQLSESRKSLAKTFSESVRSELVFLEMPGVRIETEITHTELSANGCDRVVFLISANPGEPPKSISKIASGGELSRIMLAIKNVLADKDDIPTLIFDEIDAGVSGRAAGRIGQKLQQVSVGRQIICITHLAQIAAFSDLHFLIEKKSDGKTTETFVRLLETEQRVQELARIMGGVEITPLLIENAREQLFSAQRLRS